MIQNATPQTLADPKLIDLAINRVNNELRSALSWLTTAYGVTECLEREVNGSRYTYPAIYANNNEYIDMMPDAHLGSYSFAEIADPVEMEMIVSNQPGKINCNASLIFWYDFRDVFSSEDPDEYTGRNVEDQVITVLRGLITGVQIRDISIERKAQNVYRGYSFDQVQHQYWRRPYGGFRVNFRLRFDQSTC